GTRSTSNGLKLRTDGEMTVDKGNYSETELVCTKFLFQKEGTKMAEYRMKVAPDTVAYADGENHKLVVEFAIPGAPTDTIDVKILQDSIHLTAPARDVEYVSALALGWPVKPEKAEAAYEHGLLRIEVPFKDPM